MQSKQNKSDAQLIKAVYAAFNNARKTSRAADVKWKAAHDINMQPVISAKNSVKWKIAGKAYKKAEKAAAAWQALELECNAVVNANNAMEHVEGNRTMRKGAIRYRRKCNCMRPFAKAGTEFVTHPYAGQWYKKQTA